MRRKYYGKGRNRYVRSRSNTRYYNGIVDSLLGAYFFYVMLLCIPIAFALFLLKIISNLIIVCIPFFIVCILYLVKRIDLRYFMYDASNMNDSLFGKINGLTLVNLRRKKTAIIITLFSFIYILFLYRRIIEFIYEVSESIIVDYYLNLYVMINYHDITLSLIGEFVIIIMISILFAFLLYIFILCVLIVFNQILRFFSIQADILLFFEKKQVMLLVNMFFLLLVIIQVAIIPINVIAGSSDFWVQNVYDFFRFCLW